MLDVQQDLMNSPELRDTMPSDEMTLYRAMQVQT